MQTRIDFTTNKHASLRASLPGRRGEPSWNGKHGTMASRRERERERSLSWQGVLADSIYIKCKNLDFRDLNWRLEKL